jgi:hypothetical protein
VWLNSNVFSIIPFAAAPIASPKICQPVCENSVKSHTSSERQQQLTRCIATCGQTGVCLQLHEGINPARVHVNLMRQLRERLETDGMSESCEVKRVRLTLPIFDFQVILQARHASVATLSTCKALHDRCNRHLSCVYP